MKLFALTLLLLLLSTFGFGQRVGSKTPIFGVDKYNSLTNDGVLTFEIDCRMADCISHVQIVDIDRIKKKKSFWEKIHDWWWFKIIKRFDFQTAKKFDSEITEDNYFLKDLDDGGEHIYMKCELITIKSLFGRKLLKKRVRINIFSLSGKRIYTKDFLLDKIKLLEK